MCGIAGVVAFRSAAPSRETLVAMAGALYHRGPDEQGIYRAPHVGLAHARLSIIDLASGQQPLVIDPGEHELAIVFNGEIFNYVELRAELVAAGAHFHTQSDTEVALVAFKHWGEAAFARFNGQFAIAIWDRAHRRLTLARDRLGVRPLYLCEHAGALYFASEVKALFAADQAIPRAFDPAGLGETFTFWTVVPPQSVFRGVSELRPGHVRTITADTATERAYWEPSYAETFRGTIGEAAEAVRAALAQATRLRMLRADVTVGSYLSGGLDSSVVAALAKDAIGDRLKTFSLRFTDAEFDETTYQREMVTRLGSEHSEVMVSRADIAAIFPDTIRHTERPLLRTAPAPLLLLARLVRDRGIKVVLTGEGADEMLAGYDIFREARVRRFWAREPKSQRRPLLLEKLYPYLTRSPTRAKAMAREFFGRDLDRADAPDFAHAPRWRSAAALQRLFLPDVRAGFGDPAARLLATLPAAFASWDPLARDQYLEVRTLLSGYLLSSQGDRVAMASSIEGRFPFLDIDVVALANSLPADYKLRVLDEKHVLKRAAADLVAPSILARPKQPYRAPDALAFTQAAWVPELLAEVPAAGVFEPRATQQLWEKCRATERDISNTDNMALVGVISTQLLHRELIARPSLPTKITPRTLIDRVDPT